MKLSDITGMNKRERKPKGQSRMDNPETHCMISTT